jgi:hypothetical protein
MKYEAEAEIMEISPAELVELKAKVENNHLDQEAIRRLIALIDTYSYVHFLITEKNITIHKLNRLLYATSSSSEKSANIQELLKRDDACQSKESDLEESEVEMESMSSIEIGCDGLSESVSVASVVSVGDDAVGIIDSVEDQEERGKKKGHGRNGVSVYREAERKAISHPLLQVGSKCPGCPAGKLFRLKSPSVLLRLTGHAPISAKVYELERLRCSSCGAVFKAPLPPGVGEEKYDQASCAMVCLLKYGNGFAFYRLEKFQENMGVPLPIGTQWEMVKSVLGVGKLIFEELLNMAAQGEVIHNDDTHVQILSIDKAIKEGEIDDGRTGTFTTGIIAKIGERGEREIAIYVSGRKHAGENLEEMLKRRDLSLGPPIQMCDAKSGNSPKTHKDEGAKTIVANCLTHARRRFVELADTFPDECKTVVGYLAKVYTIDDYARQNKLSPRARLALHQLNSKKIMDQLKQWLDCQFIEKKVEPNSNLGSAIKYMQRHWEKLTLFLSVENAPLDNNVVEQSLKRPILNRKNSYFYLTENGAHAGDIFMSIIQTCSKAKINAYDYLIKLQLYEKNVKRNPLAWLPWYYENTIKKLGP